MQWGVLCQVKEKDAPDRGHVRPQHDAGELRRVLPGRVAVQWRASEQFALVGVFAVRVAWWSASRARTASKGYTSTGCARCAKGSAKRASARRRAVPRFRAGPQDILVITIQECLKINKPVGNH